MMAKAHGVQPGATGEENPPVSHRYRLSAEKPNNCMTISVRNAPIRREAKRAEKSATPQPNAADTPRRISKCVSIVKALFAGLKPDFSLKMFWPGGRPGAP